MVIINSHLLLGNFWRDANNRRHFFDQLAKKKGFDPLIPDNWYSLSKATMISEKVIFYRKTYANVLIERNGGVVLL